VRRSAQKGLGQVHGSAVEGAIAISSRRRTANNEPIGRAELFEWVAGQADSTDGNVQEPFSISLRGR
jgi:hypothetical protein